MILFDYSLFVYNIIAYFIGSIPTGFIIARLNGVHDIRQHGSGNIGATNVARMLGIKYFFVVLFYDFLKAFAYIFTLQKFGVDHKYQACAAIALLIGNAYPVFLGFQGGKGIATSVGVLMALNPWLLVYALLCWVIVFAITKTVGKASIVVLMLIPVISAFVLQDDQWFIGFACIISLWGLFRHRTNITMYYNALYE